MAQFSYHVIIFKSICRSKKTWKTSPKNADVFKGKKALEKLHEKIFLGELL